MLTCGDIQVNSSGLTYAFSEMCEEDFLLCWDERFREAWLYFALWMKERAEKLDRRQIEEDLARHNMRLAVTHAHTQVRTTTRTHSWEGTSESLGNVALCLCACVCKTCATLFITYVWQWFNLLLILRVDNSCNVCGLILLFASRSVLLLLCLIVQWCACRPFSFICLLSFAL